MTESLSHVNPRCFDSSRCALHTSSMSVVYCGNCGACSHTGPCITPTPRRFRKRPVVIEAVQLRWDNWNEMCEFAGVGPLTDGKPQGCYIQPDGSGGESATDVIGLHIPTLEGLMLAREGDWVIKGIKGEFYPCKPDIFEATYEPL